MVIPSPYLPDIMQGIVARVDAAFSARPIDPFNVFFDKGIHSQVSRNVYANPNNFPLVWLVMNFVEKRGNPLIWGEISCNLTLAMPTDNKFTQQQRDDISFLPRLIPIYDVLMQEIARERWFSFSGPGKIDHFRMLRPYWGGGDVNGTDSPNLFKKQIDAITISGLKLIVKLQNCNPSDYPLNRNTNYPAPASILLFEDDLELVVDGGNESDPLAGATSVIIPSLKDKKYDVVQRAFGELRKERDIEVQDDAVNGGFALLGGLKFNHGDTYFVKISPSVVSDITGLTGTLKTVKAVFIGTNS